jgi:hypothetical protein
VVPKKEIEGLLADQDKTVLEKRAAPLNNNLSGYKRFKGSNLANGTPNMSTQMNASG